MNEEAVRASFAQQAQWCEEFGSPFTSRLLAGLGEHLDRSTLTGRSTLDWVGISDPVFDALALRLAGALHALVRRGQAGRLADLYPPAPLPETGDLTERALETIAAQDEGIAAFLTHAPQTNEVARSAMLYAGFMEISSRTGLPLATYELGASAGLNMISDRYGYQFGDGRAGDPNSPLQIAPDWEGGQPIGRPRIAARYGCDLNPLDLTNSDERDRMIAYIWPDQPLRLSRVEAAIELALKTPPQIDAADGVIWVTEKLRPDAGHGVVRVLYHSIAFQYFPEAAKQAISLHMEALGAQATAEAPLAWLSFENRADGGAELVLTLWPSGQPVILAHSDAHVRRVRWLAA
ncbi:MAG: DUF2332 family protein [Pseudomonadota bacterium]